MYCRRPRRTKRAKKEKKEKKEKKPVATLSTLRAKMEATGVQPERTWLDELDR